MTHALSIARRTLAAAAALTLAAASTLAAQGNRTPPMVLTIPGWADGTQIPVKFTQAGEQLSPELRWTNVPAGTQSFVLILHDLDVVTNKTLTDSLHWLAWNIPGTATSLPEGVPNVATLPDGTVQITHRNTIGFVGPGWPGPTSYHHYTAELLALDTKLSLGTTATRDAVMAAANGHILGRAALAGRFHR